MTDSEDIETLILTILLVCELIIFVTCVFGNAVVCYVMIFKDKVKNSASMYILSMSVADLLVGLIAVPTGGLQAMDHRPHNFEACATLLLLVVGISGVSLSFNTFRLNGIIITISWIFPFLTIIPLLFDDGIRDRFDGKCRMTTILSFQTMWVQSFLVLMYIALMIVLHCIMYKTLSDQASTRELVEFLQCRMMCH
jgi:4-amino-4-deoxy-L-arabinose transferase-like glycosyltransferase